MKRAVNEAGGVRGVEDRRRAREGAGSDRRSRRARSRGTRIQGHAIGFGCNPKTARVIES